MDSETAPTPPYQSDSRTTEELLTLALREDPENDGSDYWYPVAVLQCRLGKTLDLVEKLGFSDDTKARETAAAILGQGRIEKQTESERCCDILLRMLAPEKSSSVVVSIIFALGHLKDSRSVSALVALHRNEDPRVRYAVVSSLGGFEDAMAVEAMTERTNDEDRDVRNWATFGIGSMIEKDSKTIRDALVARLDDKDDEIRGEAFVGLARRGDLRVIPALLKELDGLDIDILRGWILVIEAAEEVVGHASRSTSKEWLPLLMKLKALEIGDAVETKAAIARCTPTEQQ